MPVSCQDLTNTALYSYSSGTLRSREVGQLLCRAPLGARTPWSCSRTSAFHSLPREGLPYLLVTPSGQRRRKDQAPWIQDFRTSSFALKRPLSGRRGSLFWDWGTGSHRLFDLLLPQEGTARVRASWLHSSVRFLSSPLHVVSGQRMSEMNRYDIEGWEVVVGDDQQNKFCLLPGSLGG